MINNTAFDATKFSQGYPPNMEKYWWNLARNKIIAESLRRHLSKNDPILEVGCGKGIVTNYLKILKKTLLKPFHILVELNNIC